MPKRSAGMPPSIPIGTSQSIHGSVVVDVEGDIVAYTGSTVRLYSDVNGATVGCNAAAGAPDAVFEFALTGETTVDIEITDADFYAVKHILILGRCTSGKGGPLILEGARNVLATEFPELANRINIQLPDEKSRRVGQSIAAASLPALDGGK